MWYSNLSKFAGVSLSYVNTLVKPYGVETGRAVSQYGKLSAKVWTILNETNSLLFKYLASEAPRVCRKLCNGSSNAKEQGNRNAVGGGATVEEGLNKVR